MRLSRGKVKKIIRKKILNVPWGDYTDWDEAIEDRPPFMAEPLQGDTRIAPPSRIAIVLRQPSPRRRQ